MAKKVASLLPTTDALLQRFGERLRLARLRRGLTAKQVAERAGMAPMTLRSLERGASGVTIGAYLAVMQVLGIERDLDVVGEADPVGRTLQDAQLPRNSKSSRSPSAATSPAMTTRQPVRGTVSGTRRTDQTPPNKPSRQKWIEQGGFASADALASLIDSPSPGPRTAR